MPETTVPTPWAAVYRLAHDGPATWVMGSLFEHLLTASESAGALGVSLVTMPPGVGTPLHRHTHEAEAFYLLDGTLTYRAGEDTHHLEPGSFIYLPLGVPHAFRITGTEPARFLALTSPGGLMDLYDEVGIPAAERFSSSESSPARPSDAAPSPASRTSSPRSAPSSTAGTTAATHSSGPRPPTKSCPTPAVNQLQTRDS